MKEKNLDFKELNSDQKDINDILKFLSQNKVIKKLVSSCHCRDEEIKIQKELNDLAN